MEKLKTAVRNVGIKGLCSLAVVTNKSSYVISKHRYYNRRRISFPKTFESYKNRVYDRRFEKIPQYLKDMKCPFEGFLDIIFYDEKDEIIPVTEDVISNLKNICCHETVPIFLSFIKLFCDVPANVAKIECKSFDFSNFSEDKCYISVDKPLKLLKTTE